MRVLSALQGPIIRSASLCPATWRPWHCLRGGDSVVEVDEVRLAGELQQVRGELLGPAQGSRSMDHVAGQVPRVRAVQGAILRRVVRLEKVVDQRFVHTQAAVDAGAAPDLAVLMGGRGGSWPLEMPPP